MEIGLVEKVDIDHEMQQAYLDYAMSVIVSRALPDARDGLKPVHRRILYAMHDMGLRPDTPYKKSARIVGEVLGKYHPHGDMAVYEAMARMAQDFSMRYLLVDGQGNFGSVDGDSPAAMRYTEARLAAPSQNMLADIHKNTVNFSPNFDGSLAEPDVLPAALPNLLINGATGIAVGMSTSIPPHNLGEVVDALKFMLENWTKLDDLNVEDLMRFIQGPDFPTGGVIIQEPGPEDLHTAYGSGRGRVIVQARARLEEMERGRSRIIVTELPFMTNKASLIERIAELVREEKLEGIADLRDESDRQGMRIVIELTKTAEPETVLRNLYKHTPMQSTFSIILLALVDGEPRLLSLKQALRVYLDHRLEIVKRRSQYDLERARQRAHILEGLRIALKNLDEVIDLIRKAADAETARERLMKRFKLSEIQAQAILDLQLRRLASLERKKIELEYKEVLALIKELEGLLRSPAKMRAVIADELQGVKDTYGDRRRTQIVLVKAGESRRSLLTATDLVQSQVVWVTVTPDGLIARSLEDKLPRLSGSGAPAWSVRANTRDILYLVSEKGEAAALAVHSLVENEDPAGGVPYWKASALREGDRLAGLFALPPKAERADGWYILTATRAGVVKKTDLAELPGPSASGFPLVKVNEGDRLLALRLTNGAAEILLVTAAGMGIRFSEEEVRPMGLVAAGVLGIKLGAGDELAGMDVLPQPGDILLAASDGSAKRVPVKDFPKQGRYGQGVVAWKLPGKCRVVGLAVGKGAMKITLHLEKLAPKSIRLDDAPMGSRAARGAVLAEVKGSGVVGLTVPWNLPRPAAGTHSLVGPDGDGGAEKPGPGKRGRGRGEGTKPGPVGRKTAAGAKTADREAASERIAGGKVELKKTAAAGEKPAAKASEAKIPASKATGTKAAPGKTAGRQAQAGPATAPTKEVKPTQLGKAGTPKRSVRAKTAPAGASAPAAEAKGAPRRTTQAVATAREAAPARPARKTTASQPAASSTSPAGKASKPAGRSAAGAAPVEPAARGPAGKKSKAAPAAASQLPLPAITEAKPSPATGAQAGRKSPARKAAASPGAAGSPPSAKPSGPAAAAPAVEKTGRKPSPPKSPPPASAGKAVTTGEGPVPPAATASKKKRPAGS